MGGDGFAYTYLLAGSKNGLTGWELCDRNPWPETSGVEFMSGGDNRVGIA